MGAAPQFLHPYRLGSCADYEPETERMLAEAIWVRARRQIEKSVRDEKRRETTRKKENAQSSFGGGFFATIVVNDENEKRPAYILPDPAKWVCL